MRTVFIFHGVEGNPEENWFPWLKKELQYKKCNVIVPQFPTPKKQTLENWLETFEQYADQVQEDSIFIGHSLGGLFMLSLLEKYKIKLAVFVASFAKLPGNKFDDGMKTFVSPERLEFDWRKITDNCHKSMVFYGDNDPYVGFGTAQQLARNMHAKFHLMKGAGHISASSGFTKFTLLLEEMKPFLLPPLPLDRQL